MSNDYKHQVADLVRAIQARPGMDDPEWVNAQLRDRGQEPFHPGQEFSPSDPIGWIVIDTMPKWAVLGGGNVSDILDGTLIPTTEFINRGRLVEAVLKEERTLDQVAPGDPR